MSLKKKLNRVFEMGFQLGVASTTEDFNNTTYGYADEDHSVWESRYTQELTEALKEFIKYAKTNRL